MAILFFGCAAGHGQPSASAQSLSLQEAEQSVDQSEDECIEEAAERADAQLSNVVTTLSSLSQLEIQAVTLQREETWSECIASADRGKETIAARERVLYENQEAIERKVPLPVLTMSLTP